MDGVNEELSILNIKTKVIDKSKYNKSCHFILPILGQSLNWYGDMINCYLADVNQPDYKDYYIFILNKIKNNALEDLSGFSYLYETKDGYMYVYKVSEEFREDYLKFVEGKYSEFSNYYKERIYSLIKKPYRDSNIYKILNKSLELRKIIEDKVGQSIGNQEVLSIPDLTREIYNS